MIKMISKLMTKSMLVAILTFFLSFISLQAQESFEVNIDLDTIFLGNTATLTFCARNVEGEFEAPSLKGIPIISGPNTSISTSFTNGQYSSSRTFSYIIKPTESGTYFVDPAFFITNEKTLETPPIKIEVVENPNGIVQKPMAEESFDLDFMRGFDFSFRKNPFFNRDTLPIETPKSASKPKRKIKRI